MCGQMPKRQLTVRVFGWVQDWFDLFVWAGTAHSPSPAPDTIDHTGKEREKDREREREREGGAGEVWCLSLPWSPMALLTIQHPLNYPPIHSQRDKASVLVCWNNMATNLPHSNITPTLLSLDVRHAQVLQGAPLYLYLWNKQLDLFRGSCGPSKKVGPSLEADNPS